MIERVEDKRFIIDSNTGSDAIHRNPVYSYAVTKLKKSQLEGNRLAFTLGEGNDMVCQAAKFYADKIKGIDIEELMSDFGNVFNHLSNEQQFRWLGPHKGVVHLGLASVTNASLDLWAKAKDFPRRKLLIDLASEELLNTLDLSYLEDVLTQKEALDILKKAAETKQKRMDVLSTGYSRYNISIGWFNCSDAQVREDCKRAIVNGFTAMKLKVGSKDLQRDIRRAHIVREVTGNSRKVMLDANQQWTLPQAISICSNLKGMNLYWVEEPTHPDDLLAHKTLADAIAPIKLALGEHVPNRIFFKNCLQTGAAGFIQVDAVRVGGVSEFITISLLYKKFNVPVVPHVGDMGQLHQHLVLFNHIALDHETLFLERISHLKKHFVHPIKIENGVYVTPQETGGSCDLK